MANIYYALGLHMHQPPENLKLLVESNEWEAQQIIRCYERAARFAHKYNEVANFHVGFSGILLQQFRDPDIVERYEQFVDIPKMIQSYRTAKNIEIIGMGFYHPIFPLIPKTDWAEQLKLGREIVEELFGQKPQGFWPSEMAFSMEMIPAIKRAGYKYVIVDDMHVKPVSGGDKPDLMKPYIARYDGDEIIVIPRSRDLSNAQESGLDPKWFMEETTKKVETLEADGKNHLITTWSDGENGGWFRQVYENSGFFGHFFAPLMEKIRHKEAKIKCMKISDYIKKFPPTEAAIVNTGAWNVASTSGMDFRQWNGSEPQKRALKALFEANARYLELKDSKPTGERRLAMEMVHQLILNAETSCYLFWGDAWIHKIYEKLDEVNKLLGQT